MIANMCDLVVASESAFFSDPVGHTLGAAATEVLIPPWVMGARKAKEMLFSGGKISAQQAHAMGMVNRVVSDAELIDATLALAAHFDTHQLSRLSEGFLTARDRGLSSAIQKNTAPAA